MPSLVGLPGAAAKETKVEMVSSISRAIGLLKKGTATTAAGDKGSISVWIDDKGLYRAYLSQWMGVKDFFQGKTKRDLRDWLRSNWEKIHT